MISAALSIIESDEQRDELALFYSQNKNRLFYIALSKLHNESEAEDAVQEAFVRITEKPEGFFNIPTEKRLAFTDVIVRNISIDMFNRKINHPIESLEDNENEDTDIALDDQLFAKISRNEILTFIDDLPPHQRSVLMLHCLFGLSIDETAQRLDISLSAVNKRLTRARKAIRNFIDERSK